ncbi:amidohydrolase family protein [Pedobacter frigidisoli]|uniref:amidohydrolase family protein n=1 Tax=Pedobacter frigidisoli TaxID=2530455 RepID=UPI00397754D5
MDAIVPTTQNGAKIFGIKDKQGALQIGKKTDFIVLEANPLGISRTCHLLGICGKTKDIAPI